MPKSIANPANSLNSVALLACTDATQTARLIKRDLPCVRHDEILGCRPDQRDCSFADETAWGYVWDHRAVQEAPALGCLTVVPCAKIFGVHASGQQQHLAPFELQGIAQQNTAAAQGPMAWGKAAAFLAQFAPTSPLLPTALALSLKPSFSREALDAYEPNGIIVPGNFHLAEEYIPPKPEPQQFLVRTFSGLMIDKQITADLTLEHSQLLPAPLWHLAQLESLSVYAPLVQGIDGYWSGLAQLRHLTLKNLIDLTSLPQSLDGLVNLESLTLECLYKLSSLGQGLSSLTALQKVHTHQCGKLDDDNVRLSLAQSHTWFLGARSSLYRVWAKGGSEYAQQFLIEDGDEDMAFA